MKKITIGVMGLLLGVIAFSFAIPHASAQTSAVTPEVLSESERIALSGALTQLSVTLNSLQTRLATNGAGETDLNRQAMSSNLATIKSSLLGLNTAIETKIAALNEDQESPVIAANEEEGSPVIAESGEEEIIATNEPNQTAETSSNMSNFNWSKTLIAILILVAAGGIFAYSLREPKSVAGNPPQVAPSVEKK